MNLAQLFFEFQYRFRKPPWDSGITPPEVVRWIASTNQRGCALDLGCGTGTNSLYLARHGFQVVGVDFSPKAIATARTKARRAGLGIAFHQADVTRLDFLREPFDYVLDIGCFHGIDATRRADYAAHLARLTRPGSVFMLYAFSPRPPRAPRAPALFRSSGATPDEVRRQFASAFALDYLEHGDERGERASAWFWFKRR